MSFSVDFENTRDGWQGRKVGKATFVPERITEMRESQTSYGVRKYFLVFVADSDHIMSFPGKYWPPQFGIGDKVTVEVEEAKYSPNNNFVNVCNFKDAMEPLIEASGATSPSGDIDNIRLSTKYVSKEKAADGPNGIFRYYSAVNAIAEDMPDVNRVKIDTAACVLFPGQFDWVAMNMQPESNYILGQDQLQYASMLCEGTKIGGEIVVTKIETFAKDKFRKMIRMPMSELIFGEDYPLGPGAQFYYEDEDEDGNTEVYSGFIPESDFPFECSSMVNRIKEMYPEEFSHPVTINGLFERYDRIRKIDGQWITHAHFNAAGSVAAQGLDVPTIADNLVRVTDAFYRNEKYKNAANALRQMKGAVTYNKAASVFTGLGLTFTEDEYYREIESRLVAEHKDYDRNYFDILKERIDESKGAEWGGNPETGEFVAIFPEEKLIVIEMPVPNKATYFYRIHDGMSTDEALARINLASPSNGVRRSSLLSGKSFKQEIYDRWTSSRDSAWLSNRRQYLDSLVTEGIIDNINDNLKAWTGFIGRAMHRSYENYTMKLDQALSNASTMVLTNTGYEEAKRNGVIVSAVVSGAVAAITGYLIGEQIEGQKISDDIDDALLSLNTSTTLNLKELFEQGYTLAGIGKISDVVEEKQKAKASGYTDLVSISDKGMVFVLGMKARTNPQASKKTVKAFETFHDQPPKNTVSARPHMKKKDTTVLGPLKHLIYFCSKWSEDANGNVIDENNVDVHYIHEWNEEGNGNDPGPNCMYVAASKDRKDILLLGDCEVLDVGITDAESPNKDAETLLKNFTMPSDMSWIGELKEIAYIDDNGQKQIIRMKDAELATDANMKKLYIVEQ